jgi:hypothetical protein
MASRKINAQEARKTHGRGAGIDGAKPTDAAKQKNEKEEACHSQGVRKILDAQVHHNERNDK